jgi:hypothetical protein
MALYLSLVADMMCMIPQLIEHPPDFRHIVPRSI